MSGTPRWKVYDADGEYQAACKEVEAAATVVAMYGQGATIRDGSLGRMIVWRQGHPGDGDAGESYDKVAAVVATRVNMRIKTRNERYAAGREATATS